MAKTTHGTNDECPDVRWGGAARCVGHIRVTAEELGRAFAEYEQHRLSALVDGGYKEWEIQQEMAKLQSMARDYQDEVVRKMRGGK